MVNGVLTKQWIYRDQLKPVAELDGTGNIISEFIYGTKANTPDLVIRGGNTYRVVSDQLGSPVLAINTANSSDIPFQATYAAFGERTLVAGADSWMPFGFAGGIYDPDTGLTRFGLRDYDFRIGRWISKDSSFNLRGETNAYAYVGSDPLNRTDSVGAYMDQECAYKVEQGCRDGCQGVCGGFFDAACVQACIFSAGLIESLSPGRICNNEPWQQRHNCFAESQAVFQSCYDRGGLWGDCEAAQSAYYDACMFASGRGDLAQ
jgi:RHS repeat-associated protein